MRQVRYGVIGIGGVGKYHARITNENSNARLSAICDIDTDAAAKNARAFGAQAFSSVEEMLEAGVVDAVSVTVPHHLLSSIAIQCIERGVHVFVEKPLAIRISEADRVIEAARRNQVKLGVNFQYRTYRTNQIIKEALDRKDIGQVYHVLWTWNNFRSHSLNSIHPWHASFREAGGGIMIYHASHDLDLLRWFLGEPVEVCAMAVNQLERGENEDSASIVIRFACGALATMQYTFNQSYSNNTRQFGGSRGILNLPDVHSLAFDERDDILLGTYPDELKDLAESYEQYNQQPPVTWRRLRHRPSDAGIFLQNKLQGMAYRLRLKKPPTVRSGIRATLGDFFEAIIEDRDPYVTGQDARGTLQLVNAITLSAIRKKTVTLPLNPVEYDILYEEMSRDGSQIVRTG